jgi:hypothetical protein
VTWPTPKSSSFYLGGPSFLARSGEIIPDMGCVALQPFGHWREPIIFRCLGRNWRPAVPGVFYPDNTIDVLVHPPPDVAPTLISCYSY